jgi:hypothetical protein
MTCESFWVRLESICLFKTAGEMLANVEGDDHGVNPPNRIDFLLLFGQLYHKAKVVYAKTFDKSDILIPRRDIAANALTNTIKNRISDVKGGSSAAGVFKKSCDQFRRIQRKRFRSCNNEISNHEPKVDDSFGRRRLSAYPREGTGYCGPITERNPGIAHRLVNHEIFHHGSKSSIHCVHRSADSNFDSRVDCTPP